MFNLLHLRQKTNKWYLVFVFGGLYLISHIAITLTLRGIDSLQFMKVQTTFSADNFREIVLYWNDNGVLEAFRKHFYFDYFHPLWYSIFLAAFMSKVFSLNKVNNRVNFFLLFPFIAGILDIIENSLHLYIISNIENISAIIVVISGTVSNHKWLFVLVSIYVILRMLIRYLLRR